MPGGQGPSNVTYIINQGEDPVKGAAAVIRKGYKEVSFAGHSIVDTEDPETIEVLRNKPNVICLEDEEAKKPKVYTEEEVQKMKEITRRVNSVLSDFFLKIELTLVDFKIEFGKDSSGKLMVGDELNCDSMRLWEVDTGEAFDKDVYRKGGSLDQVKDVYVKSLRRIVG